jgi:predicted nucleic acid-binding Zn ribbon protein
MADGPWRKPSALGDELGKWLQQSGLSARVEQAGVVPAWAGLVGPQIAAVTTPTAVTPDGTLMVQVTTNAWMHELSLMEPELLKALNADPARPRVRRIRWQIRR